MRQFKAFTAFLDVLGFMEILAKPDWANRVNLIKDTLESAIMRADTRLKSHAILPKHRLNHIMISDSLILWIEWDGTPYQDIKTLRYLAHCVQQIQYECALNDIWLRGGISYGDVLTNEKNDNIFGMGYVSAYLLEKEADVPRVIIGTEALEAVFVPGIDFDHVLGQSTKAAYGGLSAWEGCILESVTFLI
ncbi:MAG: hypothetical protein EOP04_19425 [Proteobacteria bacterium]|nr:MAG: hypothetical protein EOP04_19425 [Pseudomonadota bacterium]